MNEDKPLTRGEAAEVIGVPKRWLADNWREGPRFYPGFKTEAQHPF